ncbi:MAG TPA: hypothetical protein VMX97_02665 [Hyphomicrobiaceae bacterium]|nr:hypothetical protein [Hyphomicrobiaceae bacterium]
MLMETARTVVEVEIVGLDTAVTKISPPRAVTEVAWMNAETVSAILL